MSPLLDEDTLDAPANANFICAKLKHYEKSSNNLGFIVDNCSTNGALTRLLGVSLVGCYSHKFNLACKRFLSPYEDVLEIVNKLMGQLKRLAFGRVFTDLLPVRRNTTCRSSTYAIVERFLELLPFISQMEEYYPLEAKFSD